MKKKLLAALMVAVLAFSMLGAAPFPQTDVDLGQQGGRLLITEPGSYVLQGKLTGCVTVDPGQGEVELRDQRPEPHRERRPFQHSGSRQHRPGGQARDERRLYG